jgi:hypothetical protein
VFRRFVFLILMVVTISSFASTVAWACPGGSVIPCFSLFSLGVDE